MNHIPVFYTPEMVADTASFSPSAKKPEAVVGSWLHKNLPIKVIAPKPVRFNQLTLAHSGKYVQGVLEGRLRNGFGDTSPEIAHSLRFTTGAMLSGAKEAIKNGMVAAAPCSGFHHAGYDFGGGYCTFNGLMVTARTLQYEGYARKIGILDLDEHYGDGTDNIIDRLKVQNIVHFTAGGSVRTAETAEHFLSKELPAVMQAFKGCDVILYQAGADPHIDDPLGGWMTTEQLARRDQIVFEAANRLHIPIVWNLAGGYQKNRRKIIEIHVNTMKACAKVYVDKSKK